MDYFECLVAFVRTLETRSFSAAARALGVSQPTVSKRLIELERRLGVQLFVRTTRRLHPTAEGLRIYEDARQAMAAVERTKASVALASPVAGGKLRVAAPAWFGRACILPHLDTYLEQHPAVTVELHLASEVVELIGEGIEIAFRVGPMPSSSLIARRIALTEHRLVAHNSYLKGRRSPRSPEDLAEHRCVILSSQKSSNRWAFDSDQGRHVVDVEGPLWVDDVDAARDAVLGGLGIGLLPLWCVRTEVAQGRASVLLPDYHPASLPISAVYSHVDLSVRARSFIDFLTGCLAAGQEKDRPARTHGRSRPQQGRVPGGSGR
ncbi:MAG TPA: LysR family transcriptional regulator [Xanthobacteraceae bacterium]|nr:LysR family transcriptional regulator [Xanthobacteraceae bacterium]